MVRLKGKYDDILMVCCDNLTHRAPGENNGSGTAPYHLLRSGSGSGTR